MKKAFTLSEVLITLTIVGIVAALTIPTAMKNFHNRLYVAQLQKVLSQIETATHTIMNDEHVDNFRETKALLSKVPTGRFKTDNSGHKVEIQVNGAEYFLDKYFKHSEADCGPKSSGGNAANVSNNCFATGSEGFMQDEDAYHSVTGYAAGGIDFASYCIQTTNGAGICMDITTSSPTLFIDVNGTADPNITGRDAFIVAITDDGTIRDWEPASSCNTNTDSGDDSFGKFASGCYQRVVDAGWKIDY